MTLWRRFVRLAGAPVGLAAADGSVWIMSERAQTLARLDPVRGTMTATGPVGERPSGLVSAGGLWVAVDAGGARHRGGTLRVASPVPTTIDPAASTSNQIPAPELLGMTNDGLVALDQVPGSDAGRLVPDLAVALPRPSANGQTYTFRLRPGIHYSTGSAVRPSDVRHSFERLFELDSSGAPFFNAILGAPLCARMPSQCNLSQGIIAGDPANTVTFHLTRPDPDFLYKLTLSYAYVLPGSTPGRESSSPLPATGPYMIARYLHGRELRLVRNPHFREWSAAAQPDGYPDEIVMRLGLGEARNAALVVSGKEDFTGNIGPIQGSARTYFLIHNPSLVHTEPLLGLGFLFLNVNAPPFNDVRVRQALNYALDRTAIMAADGGPTEAQPTCQILPPELPGYQRYCPYTRHPTPDGHWQSPDLTRARRLVATSHTQGMAVSVWDTRQPQVAFSEGVVTVAALKTARLPRLAPPPPRQHVFHLHE